MWKESGHIEDFSHIQPPAKTALKNKNFISQLRQFRSEIQNRLAENPSHMELPYRQPLKGFGHISILFFDSKRGDEITSLFPAIKGLKKASLFLAQKNTKAPIRMGNRYIKERIKIDDPSWGFLVLFHPSDREYPELIGFIGITEMAIWNWEAFSWENEELCRQPVLAKSWEGVDFCSTSSNSFQFEDWEDWKIRIEQSKVFRGDEEEPLLRATDLIDHVEFPRIAEISLLFGLHTGGLLMDLTEHYQKYNQTHPYLITDATATSIGFYQHRGFQALFPKQQKKPYVHWLNRGEKALAHETAHLHYKKLF